MVELLEEFDFSTTAARAALSRLVRRGLLARLREGRLVFYEVTRRCETLLEEGERRIFSLGTSDEWSDSWTVVWHSIPERRRLERSRFGRRLRFLGFGSVQDGTWISPHNREREVHAVVTELGVESHVGVLIGRPGADLKIDELIHRGWDLEALGERYERFDREFRRYRGAAGDRLSERDAFVVRTGLVHAFRQFPFLDPELPDELMPKRGARARAVATFHEVYERLRGPAQAHFDAITAGDRERSATPATAPG
jgi:phenylacetic acid degradation operon negative regulatory protein